MKSFVAGPLALVAAALFVCPATATPLSNASTGLTTPDQFVDFSGLSEGTIIADTYSPQGLILDGLQATSSYADSFPPTTAPAAVNFSLDQSSVTDPFTFTFTTPITDLSFLLITDLGVTSVTSYLAGSPIETFSIISDTGGSSFFGFTNTLIDRVVFNIGHDKLALIDDIAFTTEVPEPASLVLLAAGLIGLGAVRRRVG